MQSFFLTQAVFPIFAFFSFKTFIFLHFQNFIPAFAPTFILPFFTAQTSTFNILLVAFLSIALGLGIGWLVWGNVVRGLVRSFDAVSTELEMLKQHSLAQKYGSDGQVELTADDFRTENNRLQQYIKQMETDRNRIINEFKQLQKQMPTPEMLADLQALADVRNERNHLWKELLEAKKQNEILENNIMAEQQKVENLRNENQSLDNIIADEMYELRMKFLNASDALDIASQQTKTLLAENTSLKAANTHWQAEFECERKISIALSAQIQNISTKVGH